MGNYFKDRLNYLSARLSGNAAWTDTALDSVPIAYYRGGYSEDAEPLLIHAQVGRSQTELLMTDGMMQQSLDRDYFIFSADLGFTPEEGDDILDENYCKYYSKVSTRFTRATFSFTNETCKRMRIRTVVVHQGDYVQKIPDLVASWLRADSFAIGAASQPPRVE